MDLFVLAAISSIFALLAGGATFIIAMILLAARAKKKKKLVVAARTAAAQTRLEEAPTKLERPAVQFEPAKSVLIADEYDALALHVPAAETRLERNTIGLAATEELPPVPAPLPMPVAPAGVEPIPELEPTEIMIRRPDWATDGDWEYAIPRG